MSQPNRSEGQADRPLSERRSDPQVAVRPKFKRVTIEIQGKRAVVELAQSPEELQHGLMFVKSLPPNEGMLFEFPDEQVRSFWMKNTFIPLSIAFFDRDRKLVSIQEMEPAPAMMLRPPSYSSGVPAQFALEMNRGWFQKNKIRTGVFFKIVDRPTN